MNKLIISDALSGLKQVEDKSVQMCVTSPPYWNLRDYQTTPLIWGGDSNCNHIWGETKIKKQTPQRDHDSNGNFGNTRGEESFREGCAFESDIGRFCEKCDAWLGCLGSEPTPELYVEHLVEIFKEVKRVLRDDGTLWLNIGDSYAANRTYQVSPTKWKNLKQGQSSKVPEGLQSKDLIGIPWRVAFALQADGWILRSDIVWEKRNPMPESVKDRPTNSYEHVFLFAKNRDYFYDSYAVREPAQDSSKERNKYKWNSKQRTHSPNEKRGEDNREAGKLFDGETRNLRNVWSLAAEPYKGAHFAVFPSKLIEPCIKAGTSERGCCSICGAPYGRIISKGELRDDPQRKNRKNKPTQFNKDENDYLEGGTLGKVCDISTVGWKPNCNCKGNVVPCIVLDPFAGSGTTGEVALRLGREYLLIELNPDYEKLIKERLKKVPVNEDIL